MIEKLRFVVVGLYAWTTAVFFGGVLLDMLYADLLKDSIGFSERAVIFSDISDRLLGIGFLAVVVAIAAVAVSWQSRMARYLFIFSLLAFSFEFIIPIIFSFALNIVHLPGARLFPSGLASILAFIGMYKFYRK